MNDIQNKTALSVEHLLAFALQNHMIQEWDVVYTRNQLLDLLCLEQPYEGEIDLNSIEVPQTATPILTQLLDYAYEKKLIPENTNTYRDLFDTRIMGIITPKPSQVFEKFRNVKKEKGIKAATDDFYNLCQKSDYIRVDRIAKNIKWEYESDYGELEITINLTKPEKDPKEIAALKSAPQVGYPKCLLCPQNVGYAGRVNHPARQTLRTLPLRLEDENWYFQYSPYVYYNQHCIVFYEKHVPMKISKGTFARLFDFLEYFPHYFIGSNADLPVVGGSILNHDHFQGGNHIFPMEKAPVEYTLKCDGYPNVNIGVVKWPMSVLRISCIQKEPLIELAGDILAKWREYSDKDAEILAYTKDKAGNTIPHNTITPIARINKDGLFELDLVFRNNRANEDHPMGIFHPHEELHHIKKENIGLIEVMGLFILPGRLQNELSDIADILNGKSSAEKQFITSKDSPLYKHSKWIQALIDKYGTALSENEALEVLHDEVGEKCLRVLHHAGVFKTDRKGRNAFNRFLHEVNIVE